MKFKNGFWKMREGVTAYFAEQVHTVQVEARALIVYTPTKKLAHRRIEHST